MKNRFFNNYITTVLGILILLFCAIVIFMEKATPTEMSGWVALSLMFLRSKDSLIALAPKE